jgi:hypothetical protein
VDDSFAIAGFGDDSLDSLIRAGLMGVSLAKVGFGDDSLIRAGLIGVSLFGVESALTMVGIGSTRGFVSWSSTLTGPPLLVSEATLSTRPEVVDWYLLEGSSSGTSSNGSTLWVNV